MVHNLPDVVAVTGTPVPLTVARTKANWLIISAFTANAADIRVGTSTISATSGSLVPKGTSLTFPAISDDSYLDLALIYILGTTADKVGITYGTH